MTKNEKVVGYKVTDANMQCRSYQYELNKEYTHKGSISICNTGFHFCLKPNHCFNYYSFDRKNRVFEIEASGVVEHGDDKSVTNTIKFIREIPWEEVLVISNLGKDNTGHSNSGDSNSGDSNSGDSNSGNWNSGDSNSGNSNSGNWNSGDSNSGDRNSGDRNSGNRNSGDRNSGNSNSGNWNSGYRNSGDSNSGYRNSGAFCTEDNPTLYLFDKPSPFKVIEWENHKAVELMYSIDTTLWIPSNMMTDEEKKNNPKYETTEGYLKTIPIKEAWQNAWGNWTEENRKVFLTLPNFDKEKFFEITGIKVD